MSEVDMRVQPGHNKEKGWMVELDATSHIITDTKFKRSDGDFELQTHCRELDGTRGIGVAERRGDVEIYLFNSRRQQHTEKGPLHSFRIHKISFQ